MNAASDMSIAITLKIYFFKVGNILSESIAHKHSLRQVERRSVRRFSGQQIWARIGGCDGRHLKERIRRNSLGRVDNEGRCRCSAAIRQPEAKGKILTIAIEVESDDEDSQSIEAVQR